MVVKSIHSITCTKFLTHYKDSQNKKVYKDKSPGYSSLYAKLQLNIQVLVNWSKILSRVFCSSTALRISIPPSSLGWMKWAAMLTVKATSLSLRYQWLQNASRWRNIPGGNMAVVVSCIPQLRQCNQKNGEGEGERECLKHCHYRTLCDH